MWPWTGDVAPVDMLKLTTNGDEVSGLNSAQELLRHGSHAAVQNSGIVKFVERQGI